MAASADTEPRRILLLLKDIRYLYGQYLDFFLPVPASGEKLARTLSSLKDAINRFNIKYDANNKFLPVFYQLTLGLSDLLIALQGGLRSCARHYGSDMLDESDWPFELDAASMEQLQARLHPISMGVDIINEAIELALIESSGMRTLETVEEIYKRIDEAKNSSARLSTLLDNFFHGFTSQTKLETTDGRDLHTFTSANISHREVGQDIAAKLRQKTQEALSTKQKDEGRLAWMIRHSIYWFSKSSEDLREWRSENGRALSCHTISVSEKTGPMIAKMFLDAIKAAWLLRDLGDLRVYEEPSFEIQQVVACAKKKVLGLLQSFYRDIFTVPNYNLIDEIADFGICTGEERNQKASQLFDSHSLFSSSVSEPETIHRQPTNSTFLAELEASSPVSLTDTDSHDISELRSIPSTLMETNHSRLSAEGVNAANISTLADGLHITHLEELSADQESIDHLPAGLCENELSNAETETPDAVWAGFQYNVFSIDSNPPNNTAFIRTCVRIFKLDPHVSSYLHLMTFREALPMSRSVIKPSTTALVPAYAFAAERSESSEIYISDSGMQPSLRYQFDCKDSNGDDYPWELYGFQGALMRAHFESDYKAASVSLQRCGSQTTERERFPRIQVWTDFSNVQAAISDSSSHASRSTNSASSSSTLSSISSKDFSALTSRLTHNVNGTKIYIFSRNFIYVFFVSERITLTRPKQGGLLQNGRHQEKKRVRIIPNKHSGASAIRVCTLKGTRDMPAGIPLDGRGIKYGDQERADGEFEDFQSIEFEFAHEDEATELINHYKDYEAEWRRRCAPVDSFRDLQRSRRITVSSRTIIQAGKRRRMMP